MRTRLVPVLIGVTALFASACTEEAATTGAGGGSTGSGGAGGSGDALGPWAAHTVDLDELTPVWGGIVAQESPTRAYLAGGLTRSNGFASTKVFRVEQSGADVAVTTVSEEIADRYCGCAILDAARDELVVLGGRNGAFIETPTAELVDLASGAVTALDPSGAADHPVGCNGVFLPDRDEGYVFGGLAQSGGFTNAIYRYSPIDHSFTEITVAGSAPPARYDGAFRYPVEGGPIYLVSGMGQKGIGAKFYGDVWTFDPATETWAEIAISGDVPPGRRLPFVAFADDQSAMVMAFGSDSPQGQTMLGDLWRLDLATNTWTQPGFGDAPPSARGFAQWLPGPEGSAGLYNGGLDGMGVVKEHLVVDPPSRDVTWR